MVIRLVTQLVLASSLFQLFPHDVSVIERRATLPDAGVREQVPPMTAMLSLFTRPLPSAGDAARGPVKVDPASVGVVTSAVSAMVIDRSSGKVLFEKNAGETRSIGSITKLMTASVFLEGNPDLDAQARIQPEDLRYGGIQHIAVGDDISVRDMLYASLVGSDNSATAALVRLSGMPHGDFIARMNELAAELGLRDTRFVDATGLSPDNRSIAPDVTILIDETMRNEVIRAATELPDYSFVGASGRRYTVTTTNELLGSFLNSDPYRILGGKTGYLPEAGYCFGSLFSEDSAHEIIVVVLGSYSKQARFQDAKALAAWAYKVFDWPDEVRQANAAPL